jgi:hypothetical protein
VVEGAQARYRSERALKSASGALEAPTDHFNGDDGGVCGSSLRCSPRYYVMF